MLDWFLRQFVRTLLGLRYRIRVTGLAEIARRGRRGILFLPNHPALIDPFILMAVLGSKFRPGALADQDQIDRFFVRWLARQAGVRAIPDLEKHGGDSPDAVRAALAASMDGLRRGQNLLLYPAGRIYRRRFEEIRAASAAHMMLREVPQVRVVLIRTRGLWGSGFGWAGGRPPRVGKVLMSGLRGLIASAIFLAPRRDVTIEMVEPEDLPQTASRAELNKYLENFYNQDAPPNTYVPYSIWEPGGPKIMPEPAAPVRAAQAAGVPDATRQIVLDRLREMSGRREVSDADRLANDLGIDSLAKADLLVWMEKEFGFGQVPPDAIETVQDVLLAACGETGGGAASIPPPANRWFREDGQTGRLALPGGERITDLFLEQVRRHGGRAVLADTLAGVKTFRDVATAAMVLTPIFRKLPGQYLGLMLPAGVTATVAYISALLAGKTPVMVNWTLGSRNLPHSLASLEVRRVVTARRLVSKLAADGNDLSALESGMGVSPMCSTGVPPVSSGSSISSPEQRKQQQQDRAGTALEHTGKMPVPRGMGVPPVSSGSSVSSPEQQKQQQQDRAGTALEHTGKMPVPHSEHTGKMPVPHSEGLFVFLEDVGKSVSRWTKLWAAMRARLGMLRSITPREVSPIAAVLFTSGSETVPKAVPLTHENILADLRSVLSVVNLPEGHRLLGMLPPFHSFGLTVTTVLPLVSGLRTCYWPNPTEAAALVAMIEAYKATLAVGTPTFLGGIARAAGTGQLDSLRLAVTGAEKCSPRVYGSLSRACPSMKILEGYGITECSPIVAVNDDADPQPGTIGKVLPGVEYAIVDEAGTSRSPAGEPGMLLVRGATIFGGYLNYNGPSPFVEFESKRWYRTGDLVKEDAGGVLTFVGRLKRFVKLGGEMISLPAVEAVLETQYASDSDKGPTIAVHAAPDAEHPELVLFTTLPVSREEANRHIQAAGLSPLHNIRKVVRVESIPVLGTGKTDYRALGEQLAIK